MIDICALGEIAVYNALTKLGLAPNEAEKAVADVANAKEVEAKLDIAELKTEIGKLETARNVYYLASDDGSWHCCCNY